MSIFLYRLTGCCRYKPEGAQAYNPYFKRLTTPEMRYPVSRYDEIKDRIREAASVLERGGVCVIPTETGYGLAASIDEIRALERIYRIKKRPPDKPLLILVEKIEQAPVNWCCILECARRVMDRFWPGPVTLLLPAEKNLPYPLTGATGRIGVRIPGHPAALELVRAVGRPVTATSANISGKKLPKSVEEVKRQLHEVVPDYFLDSGPVPSGPASTIVDVTVEPPKIIRAGAVSPEDILAVCERGPS